MHTERFYTYLISLNERDGTINAERLRTLAKSPFRRTTTTYPRRFRLKCGMVNEDVQLVLSIVQSIRDVECEGCPTNEFFGIRMSIKSNGSVGSHTLKHEEITFSSFLFSCESLFILSRPVEITMSELSIPIVIIKVMRYVNALDDAITKDLTIPLIVERRDETLSRWFGCRERNIRTPHGNTCGKSNTTLSCVVHGTIEMIDNSIVFHHIRFMGKHFIVRLRWDD